MNVEETDSMNDIPQPPEPIPPDPPANNESLSDTLHRLRAAFLASLILALADAVDRLGRAASGKSPFHNDREFKAALRLLDLAPTILLYDPQKQEKP
jgi:hypothetical protein